MSLSHMLATLAAGAVLAPAAVSAAPITIADNSQVLTRQVKVQTDDLDLATAKGKRALRSRVATAVTEVCGVGNGDNFAEGSCRQGAIAAARPQIKDAMARATLRFAEAKPAAAPVTSASGS